MSDYTVDLELLDLYDKNPSFKRFVDRIHFLLAIPETGKVPSESVEQVVEHLAEVRSVSDRMSEVEELLKKLPESAKKQLFSTMIGIVQPPTVVPSRQRSRRPTRAQHQAAAAESALVEGAELDEAPVFYPDPAPIS